MKKQKKISKKSLFVSVMKAITAIMFFLALSLGTMPARAQTAHIDSDTVTQGDTLTFCLASYSQVEFTTTLANPEWQYFPAQSVYNSTTTVTAINNGAVYILVNGNIMKYFYCYIIPAPTSPNLVSANECGDIISVDFDGLNSGILANYYWAPSGETTQTINMTTAGTVYLTISNFCGMIVDSAVISVDHSNDAYLGPDTTICLNDTLTLSTGVQNAVSYVWSNGTVNVASIDVFDPGTYSVTTTDGNGCVSSDAMTLTVLMPPTQDIGLVTIDTNNGNNRITWDIVHGNATTMNIYRELTSNNYLLVGSVAYSEAGFTDSVNSRNQPWRYKIAIVDTCGNEGPLSPYVQSIHSWVTPTVPSGYTVQWTPYLVEFNANAVSQYNIYYGHQLSQLNYLTFVSGTVTVYTLPAFLDSIYVIGAQLIAKGANDDALSNWVSETDALGISENENSRFELFPNPVSDLLQIQTTEAIQTIEIMDTGGRLLFATNRQPIDVSGLAKGMYFIRILSEKGEYKTKFVVSR
jgi:hypothetical protein